MWPDPCLHFEYKSDAKTYFEGRFAGAPSSQVLLQPVSDSLGGVPPFDQSNVNSSFLTYCTWRGFMLCTSVPVCFDPLFACWCLIHLCQLSETFQWHKNRSLLLCSHFRRTGTLNELQYRQLDTAVLWLNADSVQEILWAVYTDLPSLNNIVRTSTSHSICRGVLWKFGVDCVVVLIEDTSCYCATTLILNHMYMLLFVQLNFHYLCMNEDYVFYQVGTL